MNHSSPDAKRASPVLLRHPPPPSTRRGAARGVVSGGLSASDGCTVSVVLDMTGCSYSCKGYLGGPRRGTGF